MDREATEAAPSPALGFTVKVRIEAGTLRDLSYIAANLRPEDKAEVDCQFTEWSHAGLAALSLRDQCFIVTLDGNPEAAFGAMAIRPPSLWVAWSWGTKRIGRCIPAITKFCRAVILPDIISQGGLRIEARAMATHTGARLWLKRMGGTERCELPGWGRGGETFILFDWVADDVHCKSIWGQQVDSDGGSDNGDNPDGGQRCRAAA